MKNHIPAVKSALKNHFNRHKTFYAVSAVTAAYTWLQYVNVKDWTEFMESKDIDPNEFFCPELLEEQK
jgi:hypothetical protein